MKSNLVVVFCLAVCSMQAQYQPPVGDRSIAIASMITADVISRHLHVLASDELEGRETGTEGNAKAARYIADQFKEAGIPPVAALDGYFQKVAFSNVSLQQVTLDINGASYSHMRDFVVPAAMMPGDEIEFSGSQITFLGYGIEDAAYSDYGKKSFEGQAIMIYKGEPVDESGKSLITGTSNVSAWSGDLDRKLEVAERHGVAMVYVIEDQFRARISEERRAMFGGRTIMGVPDMDHPEFAPHILISSTTAGVIMGKKSGKVIKARDKIRAKGQSKPVKLSVENAVRVQRAVQSTPGVNVLGYIEGIDPNLKDEVVIVSAHYDHLGKRGDEIYHGADDNGSGTSAVIAIASAFAEAKRQGFGPRRSVLCMLVTGEEKGLLGSEYYSEYPVFPLENTVADVNIDMIGRVDDKHTDPNYTYVIGSNRLSAELHQINEMANAQYTHLDLDYTYNAEDDPNRFYYRSDHYNFAKHGIPSIFYFSGVHEDYHRPSDTVDKIMFDKAATIAHLAFYTTWELASRDQRIRLDKP